MPVDCSFPISAGCGGQTNGFVGSLKGWHKLPQHVQKSHILSRQQVPKFSNFRGPTSDIANAESNPPQMTLQHVFSYTSVAVFPSKCSFFLHPLFIVWIFLNNWLFFVFQTHSWKHVRHKFHFYNCLFFFRLVYATCYEEVLMFDRAYCRAE
jgi:hypothetical protein